MQGKVFEVEQIEDYCVVDRKLFFLIKWANYSELHNTLEPANSVKETKVLFQDFEAIDLLTLAEKKKINKAKVQFLVKDIKRTERGVCLKEIEGIVKKGDSYYAKLTFSDGTKESLNLTFVEARYPNELIDFYQDYI